MTPTDFATDCPLTYRQLQDAVAGRPLHGIRMDVSEDAAGPFLIITCVLADGVETFTTREPWQPGTMH